MKIAPNKILTLFAVLLFCNFAFSTNNPPAPAPSALPPPPGLTVDNGVYFLLAFSLILAFYKLSKIKKTLN